MSSIKSSINQRRFFLNILLPSLLTFGLFIIMIFGIIIPYFRNNMLESKKEMIRELVNAATGVAEKYYHDSRAGVMSDEEARRAALTRIGNMRYGTANKDYFWITDKHPRMIMHPYKPELDGQDLSDFSDPEGKKLFVEMTERVKESGSGYVDYMWQWMDDSSRIVPKISYVSEFEPWGWVIGTGVYIEDIRAEISAIMKKLIFMSLGISLIMAVLLIIIVRNNLRAEIRRHTAETELKASRERYKAMVDTSNESSMMLLGSRCVYANKSLKEVLGPLNERYSGNLEGLLHPSCTADMQRIKSYDRNSGKVMQLDTLLRKKDGSALPVLLSVSGISIGEEQGLILRIKELGATEAGHGNESLLWQMGMQLSMGVFRALPGRKGRFVRVNDKAARLLGFSSPDEMMQHNIFDLVEDPRDAIHFMKAITEKGSVFSYPLKIRRSSGGHGVIGVTSALVTADDGSLLYTEGFINDISSELESDFEKDSLLEALQASVSLYHSPALNFSKKAVYCATDTTTDDAMMLMQSFNTGMLLVKDASESVTGSLSMKEIATCLIKKQDGKNLTAAGMMRSPVAAIPEHTGVGEALSYMEESGNDTIALRGGDGNFTGILSLRDICLTIKRAALPYQTLLPENITLSGLTAMKTELAVRVAAMVTAGTGAETITKYITGYSSAATHHIIRMAIASCGPPPAPFAFIALGSEGRSEQSLTSDQDNALVYADPEPGKEEEYRRYFLDFGDKVCALLDDSGFEKCPGEIMASNPKWNQPLSVWQKYFAQWVMAPEPQHLLDTSVFFDFRLIYGSGEIEEGLREAKNKLLQTNPGFFSHMARVCFSYKIPAGIFGKIQPDTREMHGSFPGLKNTIRVIVNCVILYGHKHGVDAQNTRERIAALYKLNVFPSELYHDLISILDQLMLLQFRLQSENKPGQRLKENEQALHGLTPLQTEQLRVLLSRISEFQSRIKYDFGISM